MARISTWSKTAASNTQTPPDGAPEGMAPSTVNDTMREMMAQVKTSLAMIEWFDDGDDYTKKAANKVKVSGTHTTTYHAGRRVLVKHTGGNDYGEIAEASLSSGNTILTITRDSGSTATFTGTVSQFFRASVSEGLSKSASPGGWRLLGSQTGSAVTALTFSDLSLAAYDVVKLVINVTPADDDKDVLVQVSHAGVFAAGTGYGYHVGGGVSSSASYAAATSGGAAAFALTQSGVGNASGEAYKGIFYLHNPSVAAAHYAHAQGAYVGAPGTSNVANMGGFQNTAAAIDGLRVTVESGGNLTGTATLYGLRK